ncbi:4Fe-4S dicluster domain-containing protein [Desulfocurvus sp. DL9XJH121]
MTSTTAAESRNDALAPVREMVAACMQCGTCSASCPNAAEMDMTPRRMWRLTLLGQGEAVFASRTFWLCSNCYSCTLRCPRGLPLTRAMNALKRAAGDMGDKGLRRRASFYRTFMDNVRTHGRVQETDLMRSWMLAAGNPLLPLSFAPLGLKMLCKGKMHLTTPAAPKGGRLGPLFAKAAEMEGKDMEGRS